MTHEGQAYGQNSKFWQFWGLYPDISAQINVKFGTWERTFGEVWQISNKDNSANRQVLHKLVLLVSNWGRTFFRMSIFISTPKIVRMDNSIHSRNITISILQTQTSAILKFFPRFWGWPYHRNPHEFLHKIAKLHSYRTSQCGNMTSYRFFNMAGAAAQL